jgi:hypothetical protein
MLPKYPELGADNLVLETSVNVVSLALQDLIRSCMDANGKPIAPSSKAVAKARGYLPQHFELAYKKKD